MQTNAVFSGRWVNSNDRVHLGLSHTALEADGDTLSDLTSVRRANMEANDLIVLLVDKHFSVTCALALSDHLVVGPFEGLEPRMIGCDVSLSVSLLGLLLR